MKVTSFYKMLM